MTRKIAPQPLEHQIVLPILQWLQAQHPQWCWVRCEPASAVRARANRGKGWSMGGKMPEDAWGDGVSDILGIRRQWNDCMAIAFEVKRPGQKQRPSQLAFQERWEKAGGRYYVVHSVEEVMEAMK